MSIELQQVGKHNVLEYALPVIAATTGIVDSIKYAHTLQIKPSELWRYFKKSANLAVCYVGFAQDISLTQARGAGHAAFLSCAYDVVTDWQKPVSLQNTYAGILCKEASNELVVMALGLLDRDLRGVLLEDGLERGVVATESVLRMMSVRDIFDKKCNIQQLGLNLQIVDDVLDYDDDIKQGDQNCLTNTTFREAYLRRLPEDLDDSKLRELFPHGGILTYAIRHARYKAEKMITYPERYFA